MLQSSSSSSSSLSSSLLLPLASSFTSFKSRSTYLLSSSTSLSEPNFTTATPPKLTVVIPAYNEKDRIGETLIQYSKYLSSSECSDFLSYPTEILVMDDGSTDGTSMEVHRIASEIQLASVETLTPEESIHVTVPKIEIKCIRLPSNMGKGGAITEGCRQVRPESSLLLTADADGSGDIESFKDMLLTLHDTIMSSSVSSSSSSSSIWDIAALVVGIRPYDIEGKDGTEPKSFSSSPIIRSIFRWGFRTTVKTICFPNDLGVTDTQCGLKLMTTSAAKELYPRLHFQGWTHDVELFFIAKQLGFIQISETNVGWIDKDGSKFIKSPNDTVKVIFRMLWDVIVMRYMYLSGKWSV